MPDEDEIVFDSVSVDEFLAVQEQAMQDADREVSYDEDEYREE